MARKKKFYLVYRTWNIVTGSYYIGMHATDDLYDGYLGSGLRLKHAINKYGVEKFRRRILKFCDSREQMIYWEKKYIAKHLGREKCMNIAEGGHGGWHHVNSDPILSELRKKYSAVGRERGRKTFQEKMRNDPEYAEKHREHLRRIQKEASKKSASLRRGRPGKKHTPEAKAKIGAANSIKVCGENNGSYGSAWLSHDQARLVAKVHRERVQEFLDAGWRRGRTKGYNLVQSKYLDDA